MREDFRKRLEELYAKIDAALSGSQGNLCGSCYECCSARSVCIHRIGIMEMEYLKSATSGEALERFGEYISHKMDSEGRILHQVCPFYSFEIPGCAAYSARPLSCRIYGHFFIEGSSVPEGCAYRERGIYFSQGDYFRVIPNAEEFRQMGREFFSTRPYHLATIQKDMEMLKERGKDPLLLAFNTGDPLDEALSCQLKQDMEGAMSAFKQALETQPSSSLVHYYLGNFYDEQGHLDKAAEHYRTAVGLDPSDSLFHYRLGLDLCLLGEMEESFREFEHTARLNPENSMALGFMGYICLDRGELKAGVEFLKKAVDLDPSNPYFRFRLGTGLLRLGFVKDAEREFIEACRFPATQNQADFFLKELAKLGAEGREA